MSISTSMLTAEQYALVLNLLEDDFVELKAIEITPARLTKAVSAFANASGGDIYVGIDQVFSDTPRSVWRGFANPEAANAVIQTLEHMAPLANHYEATFLHYPDAAGLVLHLTVFKSRDVLFASDKRAYVRRGAQKLPVDEAGLQRLKYDKGITSFEDELVDLPVETITNSLIILDFLLRVVPSGEPSTWLTSQRLLLKGRPTVAATLLFAENPANALPKRSAIKVLRYRTNSRGERSTLAFQPLTVEGCLYDLIYDAVDVTKNVIQDSGWIARTGSLSLAYPTDALHEVAANAVLHRDYSIPADIQIRVYDNRVEVESPGRLPGHVTTRNILGEQFARNPKLVRIINKFPHPPNKDVGEGLNAAFEAMERLRMKPPLIEERENSVLVTLRHESIGAPDDIVSEYLESHDEITNSMGRALTGLRSESKMRAVFYRLRDRGLIEQVPGRPGGKAAWRKARTR